jgi:hypothetical protein
VARIKEASTIVGFDPKNATRVATILEALEGANNKQKTQYHGELKQIYQGNWPKLKTYNHSLLPVSVKPQPKARRNRGNAMATSVS